MSIAPKRKLAWANFAEAAHDSINSALRLRPYFAAAYITRGHIHRAKNQIAKAIEDYTTAIHIEPGDDEAWYNRALAYEWRRQFTAAEADLTRALELNPDFGAAYEIRGRLRARLFNYKGAIADIRAYLGERCRDKLPKTAAKCKAISSCCERSGCSGGW